MTENAVGLLVLASDETFEPDMRRLLPQTGLPIHTARVAHGGEVSEDSLVGMADPIGEAAASLPPAPKYDAIAYGCTSATAILGVGKVTEQILANRVAEAVTTPLIALIWACKSLGLNVPAVVSPYVPEVAAQVTGALTKSGMTVPATACFKEPNEAAVARLSADVIAQAAQEVGARSDADCVILSCTNLPTLNVIRPLEAVLGKPVLSSNLATAWHIRQLVGLKPPSRPSALLL
ncbi:MAG: Asp/Glu racemase [Pseudomonadota bacterium]